MNFWTLWLAVVLFVLAIGFSEGTEIIAEIMRRFRK